MMSTRVDCRPTKRRKTCSTASHDTGFEVEIAQNEAEKTLFSSGEKLKLRSQHSSGNLDSFVKQWSAEAANVLASFSPSETESSGCRSQINRKSRRRTVTRCSYEESSDSEDSESVSNEYLPEAEQSDGDVDTSSQDNEGDTENSEPPQPRRKRGRPRVRPIPTPLTSAVTEAEKELHALLAGQKSDRTKFRQVKVETPESAVNTSDAVDDGQESETEYHRVEWGHSVLHTRKGSFRMNEARRLAIKKQYGVTVKMGPFSAEEDAVILKNWKTFVELHHLDNEPPLAWLNVSYKFTDKLLRLMGSAYDANTLKEKKNGWSLAYHLSRGLPERMLCSICERAPSLFYRAHERFTEDDDQFVLDYKELGYSMREIGILMKRHAPSLSRRLRLLDGSFGNYWTGPLASVELDWLLLCVLVLYNKKELSDLENLDPEAISWAVIMKMNNTLFNRRESALKTRYKLYHKANFESDGIDRPWDHQYYRVDFENELLEKVQALKVQSIEVIDFEQLAASFHPWKLDPEELKSYLIQLLTSGCRKGAEAKACYSEEVAMKFGENISEACRLKLESLIGKFQGQYQRFKDVTAKEIAKVGISRETFLDAMNVLKKYYKSGEVKTVEKDVLEILTADERIGEVAPRCANVIAKAVRLFDFKASDDHALVLGQNLDEVEPPAVRSRLKFIRKRLKTFC